MEPTSNLAEEECSSLLLEATSLYEKAAETSSTDISIARTFTKSLFEKYSGPSAPGVVRSELNLERDGGKYRAFMYRNENKPDASASPLVIFFHGGGWSVGDAECYDAFISQLCEASNVDFLSVDFRQAPEHKYPTAHLDCYFAAKSIIESADSVGVDLERVALMGDSAGASLAIAVSKRLLQQDNMSPSALYLLYPFLDARNSHEIYDSRMVFGDGDFLIGRDGLELASEWYTGDRTAMNFPELTPVSNLDTLNFPPTVLLTASCDPLRDEARVFANKLIATGTDVRMREVTGAIHGFLPFGELQIAVGARNWLAEDISARLRADSNGIQTCS